MPFKFVRNIFRRSRNSAGQRKSNQSRSRIRQHLVEQLEDRKLLAVDSITTVGVQQTENFDAMAATLTLPTGWRVQGTAAPSHGAGNGTVTQQSSGPSPTAGGTYNFGSTTAERAIGAMTSGSFSSPNSYMVQITNNSGSTIDKLTVGYIAERYRINSAAASIQFFYSTNGSTWTSIAPGDIASSSFPTGASSYTFASPLQITRSGIETPSLNLAAGGSVYLRWNINTTGSNSQGIAIDDVTVTASALSADVTPPTVTSIDDGDSDDTVVVGSPLTYTISFSEDIDQITVLPADFDNEGTASVSFGTVAETSPNSGVFSLQVTPTTIGTLKLRIPSGAVITDVAGNSLVVPVSDNDTVTVVASDTTPPTVTSIDDGDADNIVLTNALLTYTISFSEDIDESTLTAADFDNSGTASFSIGTITETTPTSGVFTVQVTPTTSGTLTLRIPTGSVITDTAANSLVVPVVDNDTLTVNTPDTTPPTLTSMVDNIGGAAIFQGQIVNYTITFDEDINSSTVSAADFDNAGTASITLSGISETSPGVFSVVATATSAGTLNLRVPATATIADTSGNNLVGPVTDDTTITVNAATSNLTAGDIAVIGYDTVGSPDRFMIVALKPLAAGTVFYVSDNEIATSGGLAFTDLAEVEASFTVKAGQSISAGTVISLPWGSAAVDATQYVWSSTSSAGFGNNNEEIYLYSANSISDLTATAFIYGVSIGTSTSPIASDLTAGTSFIEPSGASARYKTTGAVYSGNQLALLSAIGDTANNWEQVAPVAANDWTFTLTTLTTPTITATPTTKEYDGSAIAISATADDGPGGLAPDTSNFTYTFYAGPNLTGGTLGSAPKNAGSYSVDIAYAGNSNYSAVASTNFNFAITPKLLTATASASNKIYDRTTTATVAITLVGTVGSDVVSGSASGTFSDKNVGNGRTVTVGAISLTGADAGNYSVGSAASVSADISAKVVSATGSAQDKVYDGNTTAVVSISLTRIISPDAVTASASGNFDTAGVGNNKAVVLGTVSLTGADAANYSVGTTTNPTANITAKALTISGASANNKVYDGNNSATISGALSGIVGSDNVTLVGTGTFASFNVASGIAVTSTSTLGGTAASNYSLTQPSGLTADITAKALTISGASANNKIYDGNNSATVSGTLSGVVGSDNVTLVGTGTFASSNVASGIAVTSTSTLGGTAASNYSLTQPTGLTADITAKALTISGASANNKVYDGNISATISGALSGIVGSDNVTLVGTGTFVSFNVASGIAVTSTSTLGGTAASNYSLTQPTGLTADITAKALTISGASANNKIYDGNNTATVSGTLSGIVGSDSVTLVGTGTFVSFNVASGIAVTSTSTLGGTAASNYTLTQPTGLTADITPKALTVTADSKFKTVGQSDPALTYAASGFVVGESAATALTGSLTRDAGESVGNYTIRQGSLAAVNGNYALTFGTGTLSILSPIALGSYGINAGAAQRSMLTSIAVTFNTQVTLSANAFSITNIGLSTVQNIPLSQSQIIVTPSFGTPSTTFTISFGAGAGVQTRSSGGNSLLDGNYRLDVDATKVVDSVGRSMPSNAVIGASAADNFFRLFGDIDGSGAVNAVDYAAARTAFSSPGNYNAAFDVNGDGTLTATESSAFTANYGKRRRVY